MQTFQILHISDIIFPLLASIVFLAGECSAVSNNGEASSSPPGWGAIAGALIGLLGIIIGAFLYHIFSKRREKENWEREQNQKKSESAKKAKELDGKCRTEEERYLSYLEEEHKFIRLTGFETRLRVSVSLDDVYVALRAREGGFGRMEGNYGTDIKEETSSSKSSGVYDIIGAIRRATKKKADGMVILGDPGSGKTTLLRKAVLDLARGQGARMGFAEDALPLFLPLRDVKDAGKGFSDFTSDYYQKNTDLKLDNQFFYKRLTDGRFIVFLDGLDEVASEERRLEVCGWIERAHASFGKNLFIVTSRFAGYRGPVRITGKFLEMDVQPFQDEQIRQFLEKWYEAVEVALEGDTQTSRTRGKKQAGALYRKIMDNERIKRLADNPLMLQIIALVHKDKGTLPERRVTLYEECTNVLLQNWDEAKGLKISLKAEQSRRFLQPLAYWMHGQVDRTRAGKKDVMEVIKERARETGITEGQLSEMLDNIRGGSWFDYREYARCADRFWFNPDDGIYIIGFRCARTIKK